MPAPHSQLFFAAGVTAGVLWLLGGYSASGFAWASKISAIITLIVCGPVMLGSYMVGLRVFRVKEADALFAPITRNWEDWHAVRSAKPLKTHRTVKPGKLLIENSP